LGQKTTPPIQPENLNQQKTVMEAEQTQYTERNDKTIDVQKETCETGQAANQSEQRCQSPSANDALLHRDFQASNGLIEDWTNDGELVTSNSIIFPVESNPRVALPPYRKDLLKG
jgi:hypothetical protein